MTDMLFVNFQARIATVEEDQDAELRDDPRPGGRALHAGHDVAPGRPLQDVSHPGRGHVRSSRSDTPTERSPPSATWCWRRCRRRKPRDSPSRRQRESSWRSTSTIPPSGSPISTSRTRPRSACWRGAKKLGVAGPYIAFLEAMAEAAKDLSDTPVDVDLLGAMAATMMDLGFTPEATWAIIAVTRSFGAGAHYIEEVEREGYTRLGEHLTPKELYDGPEDRPVPPLADRGKHARIRKDRHAGRMAGGIQGAAEAAGKRRRHRRRDPRPEQEDRRQELVGKKI